jgi:predicted DNA-binding protein (MmcQ/YjbR family)
MTVLAAKPGAVAQAIWAPRGSNPIAMIYRVMNKMFAILAVRGTENVILKCDPDLAHILRGKYDGVGHRSHLDQRHWIAVDLDADVPTKEIKSLAAHSYELVCEGLTRKQRVALEALAK